MFQHNTNYINAINNLRGSAGTHPEHNRHIQQICQCVQDAFAANNLPYDMALWEMRQMLKRQREEIEELKHTVQLLQKNDLPTPTPLAADIFITPQSLKQAKKDITRYLN